MTAAAPGLDAEVVVVGGGPAGAMVARALATRGRDVLLVERSRFPRSKPCGECVNPGAIEELEAAGVLQNVLALPHGRIHGWKIHPQRGGHFIGRFPPGTHAISLDRALLDQALLESASRAGVRVVLGTKVTDPLIEHHSVVGVRLADRTIVRSRLVIGADGLRSVISRRLGLVPRPPRLRRLALTAHVSASGPDPTLGELHLHHWGCVGVARVAESTANVVVMLGPESAAGIGGAPDTFFDDLIGRLSYLPHAIRISAVRTTGPFDFPTERVVADGALLVGDAAGYYDPFTGQGIFRALRGARLAAEIVHRALSARDVSAGALAEYDRAHSRLFTPGIRLQRLIQAAIDRPRLFGLAAALLRARPALADRIVAVTGDLRPVRTLAFVPSPGGRALTP
jgi:menaquinone-9 beta-reductase